MQAERLAIKDIVWLEESSNELDDISKIRIFDISYEIWKYQFYFRCTRNYHIDMWQENTIEFLQEDSDYCDEQVLEYMKDKITNIYL